MEEVGMQVAPPLFMHQNMGARFCDPGLIGKKRGLCHSSSINHHQQQPAQVHGSVDGWSPRDWEWDSSRFVARARPAEPDLLRLGSVSVAPSQKSARPPVASKSNNSMITDEEDGSSLRLQLGGSPGTGTFAGTSAGNSNSGNEQGSNCAEDPASTSSRPNKKVRPGSPGSGGGSYPMCQVDNCSEVLSKSKDYHRRHKVCELHSKATKALVGKQMQRFCQQCSRFLPLSEFDEGKRSCRRRLAGHNRRRRKTQPDDAAPPAVPPSEGNIAAGGNLDIVNLLTVLARAQGNVEQSAPACASLPDKNQLIQILSKINSLPLPADVAAGPPIPSVSTKSIFSQGALDKSKLDINTAAGSTSDLLAVLSATLASSSPDAVALSSQRNGPDIRTDKNSSSSGDKYAGLNACKKPAVDLQFLGGERSSPSYLSPMEDSDCLMQDTRPNLPLQLFSSSPGDDSSPDLTSRKYFSSDSSNPIEERSPSSSPPVTKKLFPLETTLEIPKSDRTSFGNEANLNVAASQSGTSASRMTLELFSVRNQAANHSIKSLPYQAGYTSSSGSDHSPPSFNSDPQRDRTGRIIFKLFDKDPSHFPGALRSQIYNWLSNSPSEMESYIRPGCVVLSVFVSMSSAAWGQLEENFLQRVKALVEGPDSEFWKSGRFSMNIGRQLAFHKDGKIRIFKSWSMLGSPELLLVSPFAVVSGQDTCVMLKGRNLTSPGTKIHCTYLGGYSSKEVMGLADGGTMYDEIKLSGFKVHAAAPSVLGRCFIEVENGVKGNSFPVIIADAQVCQELRLLECEFDEGAELFDVVTDDQTQQIASPKSHEEILHFLNELGWLFQRQTCSDIDVHDYMLHRFQFLLIFSVERDYCALVKRLLDLFAERNSGMDGLPKECLDALGKMHLLHRAVKRRSRKMVHLLIHFAVSCCTGTVKKYIFQPNLGGPGGITPLHLAASTSGSYDIVNELTDDPMQVGLSCWISLLDDSGQSAYAYAIMRSNHSYNDLVAQKLVDRRNGQVSVSVDIWESQASAEVRQRSSLQVNEGQKSCSKCAMMTYSRMSRSRGLLHRPFVHSMLAIAAVCVCVCVFFKSLHLNSTAFKWDNLDFGCI